jgi:hypothetical protein
MLCLLSSCLLLHAQEPAPQNPPPAPPAKPSPPPSTQPTRADQEKAQLGFENIESVFSVGVFYWRPQGDTFLRGGKQSTEPDAQRLDMPGKPKATPGIIITIPTSHSNRLELSAFQTIVNGNTTTGRQLTLFGETYDKGTYLSVGDKIRSAKVSWNYLSYPYPPLDAKFRIKTLWEIQYVNVRPNFVAPFTDTVLQSSGARSIILPTVGVGVEWVPSVKHFRFEANVDGMGFPHKSDIWGADASAIFRIRNLEVSGGAKVFHFKTSPNNQQYLSGTLWGPLATVRWVFR